MIATRRPPTASLCSLVLGLVAALVLLGAAPAAAAPVLDIQSNHFPTNIAPGGAGEYVIDVANIGDDPTSGDPISVEVELPDGLTAVSVSDGFGGFIWACAILPGGSSVSCEYDPLGIGVATINPRRQACVEQLGSNCPLAIEVEAALDAATGVATAEVCGGGDTSCATAEERLSVSVEDAAFGIQELRVAILDEDRLPSSRAGGHPFLARIGFQMNTVISEDNLGNPAGADSLEEVELRLPRGFVGNPASTLATCSREQFSTSTCPLASQVGKFEFTGSFYHHQYLPIYNLDPPNGSAARLGTNVENVATVIADAKVTPRGDYAIRLETKGISELETVLEVAVELWGTPADPRHDPNRGGCAQASVGLCPVEAPLTAFLTNPTDCSRQPAVSVTVTPWHLPGVSDTATADAYPGGLTGCESVPFEPTLDIGAVPAFSDSPAGLDVEVSVPQPGMESPAAIASAHLKRARIVLPEGVSVNPSAADGLGDCAPSQIGLISKSPIRFDDSAPSCPDASKIGSLEVETPLLEETIPGSVYLAKQGDNAFDSLLSLYLVAHRLKRGVLVKLAGKVDPDPATGRLTATFDDNPQLPFSSLRVSLKGGPRAPMALPPACGVHTAIAEFAPWSAADPENPTAGEIVTSTSSLEIAQGPDGAPCPNGGFDPSFEAGTVSPIAGAHSPLIVKVSRPDGSQTLKGLEVELPEGLTGKLKGIPYCSEAALATAHGRDGTDEQSSPSCPAESQVGVVDVGAGAGSTPFHVQSKAHLAGPYKGAPLSIAVITPAVAGPFDLGTVVVRAALAIDPKTAEITFKSDPIPHILQGVPLHIRSVSINTNRPDFTLNPTSCDPMSVGGALLGPSITKLLSSRFQVGACGALGFKPRLGLRLFGGTDRGDYQRLRATLRARPGDANIERTVVRMPRSAFLAQEHIKTLCTRVQFARDACPKGSVYGKAMAKSPLLDFPLSGPVYLRSSDNELPDLVADLRGPAHQPIRIELVGRTDSFKGALRNTFDLVPDAPISKFTLELFGGKRGLIVNSQDLCEKRAHRATVRMDAQSGRTRTLRPMVRNGCKSKGRNR